MPFFRTVWDTYKDDFYGPALFLVENMNGCEYKHVFEAFNVWKEANDVGDDCLEVANLRRLVKMDFRIKDSNLFHTYDLEYFSKRLDYVFQCHENAEERENYVAPYLCFVQSSGMGKTLVRIQSNVTPGEEYCFVCDHSMGMDGRGREQSQGRGHGVLQTKLSQGC